MCTLLYCRLSPDSDICVADSAAAEGSTCASGKVGVFLPY